MFGGAWMVLPERYFRILTASLLSLRQYQPSDGVGRIIGDNATQDMVRMDFSCTLLHSARRFNMHRTARTHAT